MQKRVHAFSFHSLVRSSIPYSHVLGYYYAFDFQREGTVERCAQHIMGTSTINLAGSAPSTEENSKRSLFCPEEWLSSGDQNQKNIDEVHCLTEEARIDVHVDTGDMYTTAVECSASEEGHRVEVCRLYMGLG